MQDVDVNIFLQSLQGKQATLVLAFLCIRRAMTLDELETCTGLNNDTVRSAVKGLASKGLLAMQRGEHGRQTWLPSGDTFFGRLFGQNPKISDSSSSSSSKKISLPLEEEQEELRPESENFGFCLKACDEAGIRDPKRRQIARLEHVTPEFIRAHVDQVIRDGLGIGSAIYRIENNWPIEAAVADQREVGEGFFCSVCAQHPCVCEEHDSDCMCISCKYDHPERFCKSILKLPRGERRVCYGYVRPGESCCDECLNKESEGE